VHAPRRLSESAALKGLCSNCVLSPTRQRVYRSGQDSRSSSCGGGTLRRRIGCSRLSPEQTTPRMAEVRMEWKAVRGPLSTGCSRTEQCPHAPARWQKDFPSPGASDRDHRRAQLRRRMGASAAVQRETLSEILVSEPRTCRWRRHLSRHICLVPSPER
jgi:hypothetical protein